MHIYNRWKQAQAKGNANKMLVLDSLRGFYYKKQLAGQGRYLVINFWASWDGRSRLEYPQWKKVDELERELKSIFQ